jgi:hypothetical protein
MGSNVPRPPKCSLVGREQRDRHFDTLNQWPCVRVRWLQLMAPARQEDGHGRCPSTLRPVEVSGSVTMRAVPLSTCWVYRLGQGRYAYKACIAGQTRLRRTRRLTYRPDKLKSREVRYHSCLECSRRRRLQNPLVDAKILKLPYKVATHQNQSTLASVAAQIESMSSGYSSD